MNSTEITLRTSAQPKLRERLSHEFRSTADDRYHVPIVSPVSSPAMRARKNRISSMLKPSFHTKSLEDHTAHTESSSGSDLSPSSPRKSKKGLASSMHALPTKGKAGILKLLSERSLSPLKISRSNGYSTHVNNESMSSLVTALNEVAVSLHSHMHTTSASRNGTSPNFAINKESVLVDEEKLLPKPVEGHFTRSTFKPYGHYMVNQADTNTLWVSSDTSPRPHLELNITRNDSPPDWMVGRSSGKRRRPVRSKSLRFGLKDVEKRGIPFHTSTSPRRNRRNSMK